MHELCIHPFRNHTMLLAIAQDESPRDAHKNIIHYNVLQNVTTFQKLIRVSIQGCTEFTQSDRHLGDPLHLSFRKHTCF